MLERSLKRKSLRLPDLGQVGSFLGCSYHAVMLVPDREEKRAFKVLSLVVVEYLLSERCKIFPRLTIGYPGSITPSELTCC